MNQATQVRDIPHEANLRLASCIRQFNKALARYKNGWQHYVIPFVAPVALSAMGLAVWQSAVISISLFFSGVCILLLLSNLRPYPHSPEYIYDNPTWAAFYASFYDYDPIRTDLLDEAADEWKKLLQKHSSAIEKPRSLDIAIDIMVLTILAEIIRQSDKDATPSKST